MEFLFIMWIINFKHSVLHKGSYVQWLTFYIIFVLSRAAGLGSVFGLQILESGPCVKIALQF
jgi:hypothetical protein